MQILVIISIIVILIIFAVLLAPVTICLVIALNRRPQMAVRIRVMLFKGTFAIKKRKEKTPLQNARKRSGVKRQQRSGVPGIGMLLVFLRERKTVGHTIRAALSFIQNLLSSVDRLFLNMRVNGGLPSPDLTGNLYGMFAALKSIGSDSLSLSFMPDFGEDKLQGEIAIGATFRIFRILKALLVFIMNLPKLKLIRLYRIYRKESANV